MKNNHEKTSVIKVINRKEVGTRIKSMRENAELSAEELCDQLSVYLKSSIDASTIYKYENNQRAFTVHMLAVYASYFKCSTDYILFGESKENNDCELRKAVHDLSKKFPLFVS